MSCMELDDQAVLTVAEPMMDDLMSGIANRDYALHSRHFSVNLKSAISAEVFLEQCDQRESDWGRPSQRDLLTIFRKEKSFTVLWHQHMDKTDDQVLAVTTIAVKGGRYFVDGFFLT